MLFTPVVLGLQGRRDQREGLLDGRRTFWGFDLMGWFEVVGIGKMNSRRGRWRGIRNEKETI